MKIILLSWLLICCYMLCAYERPMPQPPSSQPHIMPNSNQQRISRQKPVVIEKDDSTSSTMDEESTDEEASHEADDMELE